MLAASGLATRRSMKKASLIMPLVMVPGWAQNWAASVSKADIGIQNLMRICRYSLENTFIGQFPASTEFGILSVHGSFDVYRGDHLEVYVSGGYGEGTLEFEFDDPAIVEFNDGEIDVEAWFGEIGVAVEVTTHLQVVPHVQVFAWELQEDGDQIDGTETLIASLAGITVRGIW